jgi:hypothetical protein
MYLYFHSEERTLVKGEWRDPRVWIITYKREP